MPTLVCAVVAVVLGAPPSSTDVKRGLRDIAESDDYQRDLPIGEAPPELGRGTDQRERDLPPAAPRRRLDRRQRDRDAGLELGPLGSIARALLWGLIAVGVGLAIFWIARELTGYVGDESAGADEDPEAALEAPDRAVVERPLGDADELAREGRFSEAIHTLLLRTLSELARRLPQRLPPSLTSREILARVRMPDEARNALSVLVAAVEVSHFGGQDPVQADFMACRQHFQRFAEAYMRGAGA